MNSGQRAVLVVGFTAATIPLWLLFGKSSAAALIVVVLWTVSNFTAFFGAE